MPRRRPSPALIVAFLALVVSVSGAAFATIPAKDGDIHVCYSKKTGDVQLVNTQRDSFDCEKNWRGFIIDSDPTSLTSPDGRFKVEATNTGARLSGPDGSVEVGNGQVKVNGKKVTVAAETSFDVSASLIRETASATVDVLASGIVHIKGSQVQIEQGP
jgi:ferric-dicitrate binding protein FerR (iron transport regulator)